MKLDLLFPTLPPALDGIGDYTARLAAALAARGVDVRILTAAAAPDPIPGVRIERAFAFPPPDPLSGIVLDRALPPVRAVRAVENAVRRDPPDWLVVQFQQFAYGRYGFNPWLPLVVRRMRRTVPGLRVAVMMHEDFVPVTGWKFAIMTTWQRAQFWALGRAADVVFFSIEPWAERYARWFGAKPVVHLPVGSNIPRAAVSRADARAQLGLADDTFVAGVFGTLGAPRRLPLIRKALDALRERDPRLAVVYVGPHGEAFRAGIGGHPFHDAGALPAPDVAAHLAAMDLHLAPFIDGVSTRRGSFLAGLQQGTATLGTSGELTDPMLARAAPEAFALTPNGDDDAFVAAALNLHAQPERRARMGAAGEAFFERHFAWSVIADRLVTHLDSAR